MKITLVTAGALALAIVAPLSVSAQQAPPPGYQTQARAHVTPDEPTMQHRWQQRLGGLNLSGDQQRRIYSIIHGFARSHPAGSPADRAGNHALRQQIMATLSPDQAQQYREMMKQRHAMHKQNGQSANQPDDQGQYQQGPPQYGDPRDQQGPPQQGPPDQGQGPPPDYQGPPDQGQGPPPDYQGPPDQGQGPPPDYQGPPDQGQGPPPDYQGPPDQGQGPPPDQGQGPPPNQGPPPA